MKMSEMQIVPKKSENETIYCLQSIQTDCLFVKQNKKIRIKENENNVQTARENTIQKPWWYMSEHDSFFLATDMNLGKTRQASGNS